MSFFRIRSGTGRASLPHSFEISFFLILAICVAMWVRGRISFASDFPPNDGGLFVIMIEDLSLHRWKLPAFTSFNAAEIPFAYPPLAFYLGSLASMFGVTPIHYALLAPFLCSVLLVVAVAIFSRQLKLPGLAPVFAALMLAFHRGVIEWQIMGGGVTRGLGLLLATLSVLAYAKLLERPTLRWSLSTGILCGMSALAHPEASLFCFSGIAAFSIAHLRHRAQLYTACLAGFVAFITMLPWILSVVSIHGIDIFASARNAAPSVHMTSLSETWELIRRRLGYAVYDSYFPFRMPLLLLGAIFSFRFCHGALMYWWILELLLPGRTNGAFAAVPGVIMIGASLGRIHSLIASRWDTISRHGALVSTLVVIPTVVTIGALRVSKDSLAGLIPIPPQVRTDLDWIARNTEQGAHLLIIEDTSSSYGKVTEWFPALTHRVSLTTVQGSEWLGELKYDELRRRFASARHCLTSDVECLRSWSTTFRITPNYLYIPKASADTPKLLSSLKRSAQYELTYESAGGALFSAKPFPPELTEPNFKENP